MSLAPSLIALSAAVLMPVKSLAWATCADIFLSQYEGLLENRFARMAMVMKRLPHLRPGTHPVTLKTADRDGTIRAEKSDLLIAYGANGSLNLTLGGRQLIQSESLQRDLRSWTQLLPEGRLLISNSTTGGSPFDLLGRTRRDIRVEIPEAIDGRLHILVTDTLSFRAYNDSVDSVKTETFEIILAAFSE